MNVQKCTKHKNKIDFELKNASYKYLWSFLCVYLLKICLVLERTWTFQCKKNLPSLLYCLLNVIQTVKMGSFFLIAGLNVNNLGWNILYVLKTCCTLKKRKKKKRNVPKSWSEFCNVTQECFVSPSNAKPARI